MIRKNSVLMITVGVILSAPFVLAGGIIYVDVDAPGPVHDGSTWDTAFVHLQDALAVAQPDDEIRVGQGTYLPDEGSGVVAGDREATFELLDGVVIRGGFAGSGESVPDLRDVETYPTILSGDLNGDDPNVATAAELLTLTDLYENSYTVVTSEYNDGTTVLDGFTIMCGYNDLSDYSTYGAGMRIFQSSPNISNCLFTLNVGKVRYAGAVEIADNSQPVFTDCDFVRNASSEGSGFRIHDFCEVRVTRCSFSENYSTGNSAGIDARESNLHVTDCQFLRNFSVWGGTVRISGSGARIPPDGASPVTFTRCIFHANEANSSGALSISQSIVEVTDCSFVSNVAHDDGSPVGGGAIVSYNAETILRDCLFEKNLTEQGKGGAIYCQSDRELFTLVINNCVFVDNHATQGGGVEVWEKRSFGGLVTITNCTFYNNSATLIGGGIHARLGVAQQNIRNCVLWENTDETGSGQSAQIFAGTTSPNTVEYCCIQGLDGTLGGAGNTGRDPGFVDLPSYNLRLRPDSFCIDAGTNTPTGGLTEYDIDGNERVLDGDNDGAATVDIGAFELLPENEPVIMLSETQLEYEALQDRDNPAIQLVTLTNRGVQNLPWTIQAGSQSPWVIAQPSEGVLSGGQSIEIEIGCDIAGLPFGDHSGTASVISVEAVNSPKTLSIQCDITGPILEVSETNVDFGNVTFEQNLLERQVTISNGGGGTLVWTAQHDCDWLSIERSGGTVTDNTDTLVMSVSPTELAPDHYSCSVTISDESALDSPQTVTVLATKGHVLLVPQQYSTIQAAIDATADGDAVLVADGVYSEGWMSVQYRNIIVRSANESENCILFVNKVSLVSGLYAPKEVVLDGFTILGSLPDRAVISVERITPTIQNCIISGGQYGIEVLQGEVVVRNCEISNNALDGINLSDLYSDPMYSLVVENCHIHNNGRHGIGIPESYEDLFTPVTIRDSSIHHNEDAGVWGRAIFRVSGCRFYGNGSCGFGVTSFDTIVENCIVTGNASDLNWLPGLGISCTPNPEPIQILIRNCTVVNNVGDGGIGGYGLHSATVENCIVWGNEGVGQINTETDVSYVVKYSNVEGGYGGEGNMDELPSFVDSDKDDYRLLRVSPCINAGDPNYVPRENDTDVDGRPRVLYQRLDIGASEFNGSYDLQGDGIMNLADFVLFAPFWMRSDCDSTNSWCDWSDFNADGQTGSDELFLLSDHWLLGVKVPLVGYWAFDESQGVAASDSSRSANNGTLTNMDDSDWVEGKYGNALVFDGVDDFVEITGWKGILGGASRTVCAWIKTTSTSGWNPIVHWGADTAGGRWTFAINPATSYLYIMVQGDNFAIEVPGINDGLWHHVAVTWENDGTPDCDDAVLHYDGTPYTSVDDAFVAVNTLPGTEDAAIGKWGGAYFDGSIDEVRIYDRALTAEEIAALAL